jgi:hypothetical protein
MVDAATVATTADNVVKEVMKIEPTIAAGVGMFVPGAAPIIASVQPFVLMAAPFIERALEDIAKNNKGDVLASFIELVQHLTSGQPNSPTLGAAATPPMGPITN